MRMWMVNPEIMCSKHLLGEHGEIHKHKHVFVKQHSIKGRITPEVQIEPELMKERHDQLAKEMLRRGYNHSSPYEQPDLSYLSPVMRYANVDRRESLHILLSRCPKCYEKYIKKSIEDNFLRELEK